MVVVVVVDLRRWRVRGRRPQGVKMHMLVVCAVVDERTNIFFEKKPEASESDER